MKRTVTIEDKVEGPRDWAVNLYLGPGFRKIANDTLYGTAGGPRNLGAFERFYSRRLSAVAARFPAILYYWIVVDWSGACRYSHLQPLAMERKNF